MPAVTQPCREELEAVVRQCHHIESDHRRADAEGAVRHHLELQLRAVHEQFERLLHACIVNEDRRDAWRAYLHQRGPEPEGPPPIGALVFKGSAEEGSVVEIRSDRSSGLVVDVDGATARG